MKLMTIKAKVPANQKAGTKEVSAEINVSVAETIEEAIKVYGGEAILANAKKAWSLALQANIRNGLRKGETQEQIQNRLQNARMGIPVRVSKIDPIQAYMAAFASSTPEQQEKMLADLKRNARKKE